MRNRDRTGFEENLAEANLEKTTAKKKIKRSEDVLITIEEIQPNQAITVDLAEVKF